MDYTLCSECGDFKLLHNTEGSNFWQQYWSTALRCGPQLRMRKPGPKGPRSNFIKFCPLGLPSDVSLIHVLSLDCVDLRFEHFGHRLEELDRIYGIYLGRHASIVKVGRAGAIRVPVPHLDQNLPFEPQQQNVLAAIYITEERFTWLRDLFWAL